MLSNRQNTLTISYKATTNYTIALFLFTRGMKIYVDKITYSDIHVYFAHNIQTLINKLWLIKYKEVLLSWHWKRLPVKLKIVFNPSSWKTEAGRSFWIHGHPGIHSEFLASQDYIVKSCLKKWNEKGFYLYYYCYMIF